LSLQRRVRDRAFTMTELLVVIALIVLMIAMAVPTFNFITGNRSLDGTQNQLNAYLARARTEALGLQEIRGVFFYRDLRTDRIAATMVREVQRPESVAPFTFPGGVVPDVNVFLDLVPDADAVLLPAGVEVQVLDDAILNTATTPARRQDDGYIGFNTYNRGNHSRSDNSRDPVTPYGGVVLFDATGKLIHRTYAFKTYREAGTNWEATRMGDLLFKPTGVLIPKEHVHTLAPDPVYDVVPTQITAASPRPPRSAIALAIFEREPFENRPRNPARPEITPQMDPELWDSASAEYGTTQPYSEAEEERWIDENALQLLVNRYNGTLVRAQ
jgi:prepilin-type N-terminal cleavage/methylation domain-containing protein